MLAGTYRFRAVDALEYSPIQKLSGAYSISSKEEGVWTSGAKGEAFLEHLKVGLTNILIKNDKNYFDMVINGAKVFKGEQSRDQEIYGRSALMVPRNLKREILLSLSWLGSNF